MGLAAAAGPTEQVAVVNPIPGDFDKDIDVNLDDLERFEACVTGPELRYNPFVLPPGCVFPAIIGPIIPPDFDADFDVDQSDFSVFQRCLSGEDNPADPNGAD